MDIITPFFFYLGVFIVTWVATGCFRRIALMKKIVDIPNERSAHTLPIPRAGGLAFASIFFTAMMMRSWICRTSLSFSEILLCTIAVGFTVLGAVDDVYTLTPRFRLAIQGVLSLLFIVFLPDITAGVHAIIPYGPTWLYSLFSVLFLMWMVNLYNFMDGINGIASIEAVTVLLGFTLICLLTKNTGHLFIYFLLAIVCLGFLLWNFPRASIFMGDAGSNFLGFLLGGIALLSGTLNPLLFSCCLILLGVFITDATLTLCHRLLKKDNLFQAHATHAYQCAARSLQSHVVVSLSVGGINLFWLAPIALSVALTKLSPWEGILMAYAPLVILYRYLRLY